MHEDKLKQLLDKYEKLRNPPLVPEVKNFTQTKRTLKDTNEALEKELPTLKKVKNMDMKQSTRAITKQNILSKYENDESVNSIDKRMESLGESIFRNMKHFDGNTYTKSSEWYIEKELERLSKQVNKG